MFRKTNSQLSFNSIVRTIFFLSLFHSICSTATAQGNLLITPKRVVFEGNKRSEDLSLANTGQDSATYVISFINIRMREDGSFDRIEKPDSGQLFADPFLRIFPRTITLAPNESQTIKLQLRKSNDMVSGEYRSHLYFRAVPKQAPLGDKTLNSDSSISVKLTAIFGISIPVIVRNAEANTQVQMEDVTLKADSIPTLQMTFLRKGNTSAYGDIVVNHISRQGKVTQVGLARGLAVYTPNTQRSFKLLLNSNPVINYHSGKLQLLFTDQSNKAVTLAEKEILLN